MRQIEDDEMKKVMALSGIPLEYRREDATLESSEKGAEAKAWLEEDGRKLLRHGAAVVEFVSEQKEGEDLFHLFLRALVLYAIPTVTFHAQELCPPFLNDDVWESLEGVKVIGVEGLATGIEGQFDDRQRATLEWFLSSRLKNGYSLVLLNDRQIGGASEFSQRFRNRLKSQTKIRFTR